MKKSEAAVTREELVRAAHEIVETIPKPQYRTVVVVTDEAGDFIGVSSNTTLDDVDRILRCALFAEGLEFHDDEREEYSRTTKPKGVRPRKKSAATPCASGRPEVKP